MEASNGTYRGDSLRIVHVKLSREKSTVQQLSRIEQSIRRHRPVGPGIPFVDGICQLSSILVTVVVANHSKCHRSEIPVKAMENIPSRAW